MYKQALNLGIKLKLSAFLVSIISSRITILKLIFIYLHNYNFYRR